MTCAKCSAELPPASAFCPKCGAPQAAAKLPAPGPTEIEETLWIGRPTMWTSLPRWMAWGGASIGLAALRIWVPSVSTWIPAWGWLVLVGAPAAWIALSAWIARLSIRYRLSTHRLFRDRGLVVRHHSEIELMRVDDVEVTRGPLGWLLGYGTVTLLTSDTTDPRLDLAGVEDPLQVKEQIRSQVRKRRSGAINMESL